MITRDEVLSQACDACMKELYEFAVPHIKWEDFKKECEEYSKRYREWDEWKTKGTSHPEWDGKSITECIGPKPFEFYFLPRKIMKSICEEYVYAYKIDDQQNLLNIIDILKEYCRKPIVDKYIDEYTDECGNWHPGYRSYDHPDNLEKEIEDILFKSIYQYDLADLMENDPKYKDNEEYPENEQKYVAEKLQTKFFEFLDMAGNFYNWNRDLNSFNMTVYLGASPNSNREAVIKNWKEYRNQDIEIDEEKMIKEYYGDELD